ncbi:MAG TPA: cobalt-precorrin-4/precorrin-4 C(11)-methyltransferase [Candidatus Methanoperedenaceae archaeon]|nr:cobalt-precorrin-4/precorrin-4 C(11)-methyltransferase [Candidatus Methanoperedenaceae archaeon]
MTVRGGELLESADLVVYAGSLVNPRLLEYSTGKKIDSQHMKLSDITGIMAQYAEAGKTVVRLHSGDPSLYGAIYEQMEELKKRGIGCEIIPGVSSLFGCAASLRTQLTLKGVSDTLIITRPAGETLEKDALKELSAHGATMAVFLGAHRIREILAEVEYPEDTPAAVVYHATWEDEVLLRGTVADIADKAEAHKIEKSALLIIGEVLNPRSFERSHLYG